MKQLAILITAIITLRMWPLDWLREQRPLPIVYDATAARLTAIAPQPTSVKAAHPLVYDATGAMLAAINPQATEKTASLPIVYDATGAMQAALNPGVVGKAASLPIVYDATGAMQAAVIQHRAEERSAGRSPVSAPQPVSLPASGYALYLWLTLAAALAAGGWYLRHRAGHAR